MESIQRTALVAPELVSATPKKSDSKGVFGCIKDACIAVKNAPFEVKVLTGLGILCAVGSAASFAGMAFAPSVSSGGNNEAKFKEVKSKLPRSVLTSEPTILTWSNHESNNVCDIDGTQHVKTSLTKYTMQSSFNTPKSDKGTYQLMVGINDPENCKLRAVALCRKEGNSRYIDTSTVGINDDCTLYDLTKMSDVDISVIKGTDTAKAVPIEEMLNCIKTDETLGDFLNELIHMGKNIMESSSDRDGSTAQLVKLADAYEKVLPNSGIREALTLYTDVYKGKTLGERDATREYLLMAGVSAAALSGIALLASGIISCVTCANSKVQVKYYMEGNSMTITKGKNKVFYELYDPLFKNKFSDGMVMACKYAMVHGSSIDDVYEMAVETADGVDKVLGHPAVGTKIIGDVQDWLHKHHRKDFEKYCKFFGIDYNKNELGIELDNV